VDESDQSGLSIIQSASFKFGGEKTKNKKIQKEKRWIESNNTSLAQKKMRKNFRDEKSMYK